MREQRQKEAAEAYLDSDKRSIINACPRFGKIKVAIDIMWRLQPKKLLILAPRRDIFKGWEDDFMKFGWPVKNTEFVTFTSISNITHKDYDLVIIDEPHELSVNQQLKLTLFLKKKNVLGLTGTMTQKTRDELYDNLTLDVCYKYTIDQGVEEGILVDYQMFIHQVPLDHNLKVFGKPKDFTEDAWFQRYLYIRSISEGKTKHIMDLKLINIIQNSEAKRLKTVELLRKFSLDRVLVFCGVTEIADSLGIPVYHSKAREKQIFLDFCAGTGMHLATIKMMQAGITVAPINKGIINYMSGNPEDSAQKICRFLGLEYDNPDKKAEIHIVSTNEDFETSRLKTGLAFFDESKISIIKN